MNIRVLILSAYDDLPFVQAAFKAGADGYMIKTAEPAEIVDAVFKIERGEKVFSSDVRQIIEDQHMLPRDLDRPLLIHPGTGSADPGCGGILQQTDREQVGA